MKWITRFTALALALAVTPLLSLTPGGTAAGATSDAMRTLGQNANTALVSRGVDVRVGTVEWMTSADSGEEGSQIVFFNDRGNKELAFHFVPGDPRRGGRTNITYLVDQSGDTSDPTAVGQTEAAIDRAMATWERENCSTLNLTKNVDTGADPDLVDELGGFPDGPGGTFAADIVHGGWVAAGVFPPNVIQPGALRQALADDFEREVPLRAARGHERRLHRRPAGARRHRQWRPLHELGKLAAEVAGSPQ